MGQDMNFTSTAHQFEAVRQQGLLRARLERPHDEGAGQALHQPDAFTPPGCIDQRPFSNIQQARPGHVSTLRRMCTLRIAAVQSKLACAFW